MEYPILFQAFNKSVNLPIEVYLDLEKRLVRKTLNKKEFLIQEGQIINYMPFINEGLMVNYRIDDSGERHAIQIGSMGFWLGDLNSFFSAKPTKFNIRAYHTTELLMINHETFEFITKEHPVFEKYFRQIIQKAYVNTLEQIYNLHRLSAEERYLDLIKKIPSILDDVPHYLIASYLNVQPQSLSRIRKRL